MLNLHSQNKQTLLKKTLKEFVFYHQFTPYFGIELEFYLVNKNLTQIKDSAPREHYIQTLTEALSSFSLVSAIEAEQGASQIEIKTKKSADLLKIGADLLKIKSIAKRVAKSQNLVASFAAQPFINDCGSACQFNLSLYLEKQNLFTKDNNLLLNAIAGLLCEAKSIIQQVTPEQDFLRFNREINVNLHKQGKYTAPVNISFGYNNRTAAIRIPDAKIDDEKRIEFRIPPANSDPYLNMTLILQAVSKGISRDLVNDKNFNLEKYRIFGNAFDEQYSRDLTPINALAGTKSVDASYHLQS